MRAIPVSQRFAAGLQPLLKCPPFRRFWLGQVLSNLGGGIARTALILEIQQTRGLGLAVGALLFAETVPRLLGPLLGALADRRDRRKLMIGCDLGQAAAFALIALGLPFFLLLALVAVASTLQTAFNPARVAMLPSLVAPDDLPRANSLLGTAFNVQVAAGPVLGAFLFQGFGIGSVLLVNTASFLASALALWGTRIPVGLESGAVPVAQGLLETAREGGRFVREHPVIRGLTLSVLLSISFLALDDVALVFLVRDTFDGSAAAYGLTVTAFGVGMIAASIGLLAFRAPSASRLYAGALLASGAGTLATGLSPILALVIASQALAGAGNGVDNIASETLVQQKVPPELLGRTFGIVTTAANTGAGVAAIVGGLLLEVMSARAVLTVSGLGVLAVALAVWGPSRRTGADPAPSEGVALE